MTQAKAQPGKLSFASLGSSSPHYLGFEWFKRMAGIDIIDVPYKGGGQALVDLLGGQVNLSLIVAGNGMQATPRPASSSALAVTGPTRNADGARRADVRRERLPGVRAASTGTRSWRRPARRRPWSRG